MKSVNPRMSLKGLRLWVASSAAASVAVMSITACKPKGADFSEVKISKDAQSAYDVYDKVKEDSTFKANFSAVLDQKYDQDSQQLKNGLVVNGLKFEDAEKRLDLSKRVYNRAYKGTFGEQLKEVSKNLGAVEARDFQISQDILFDTLKANGDKNRLKEVLKKYSQEDYRRSFRATMIMKTYERMIRSSGSKDSLGLVNPAAAAAAGEVVKQVVTTLPNLVEQINNGKWIDANGEAIRMCTKEVELCVTGPSAAVDLPGKENANRCKLEDKPNAGCNNGLVRDQNNKENSDGSGYSVAFLGEDKCSSHKWRCYCSGAFKKRDNGKFVQNGWDQYGCNWQYWEEEAPGPAAIDENFFQKMLKICEMKTRCSVSVTVGKTN